MEDSTLIGHNQDIAGALRSYLSQSVTKEHVMNKPAKCIARAIVFWITTIVSISLFGLFSAWAMSELDPAQQEAIAAINTPWISAQRDPAPISTKAARQAPAQQGSTATSTATKR